jgi:hypothetical protein
MKTVIGLLIVCAFMGFIAFISTMVALYLLCKDIDIDDVIVEEDNYESKS